MQLVNYIVEAKEKVFKRLSALLTIVLDSTTTLFTTLDSQLSDLP